MNGLVSNIKFQYTKLMFWKSGHAETFSLMFEDNPPKISWEKIVKLLHYFHMELDAAPGNGVTMKFPKQKAECKIGGNPAEKEDKKANSAQINAIRTFLETCLKITPDNLDEILRGN